MDAMKQAVVAACEGAGGAGKLARALGISAPAVAQWRRVPAARVLAVEAASGVSRHALRPDLYPQDGAAYAVAPVEAGA